MDDKLKTLEQDGRVWFHGALNSTDIKALSQACNSSKQHGTRINWDSHQARILRKITNLHLLAEGLLTNAKPVRALVFNKSTRTNWVVPWHQDRVIAVQEKLSVEGYNNWTKKSDVWHVEPPTHILDKMVFARVHLEDSAEDNGSMEIALGSHKHGKISPETCIQIIPSFQTEMCIAQKGDVLIVKALTLHRSQASRSNKMRRTLRVDYSNQALPFPLQWAELS